MDETAFPMVPLSQPDDDVDYWLTRTPGQRLRALELTRQVSYGYKCSSVRLERYLSVVQRDPPSTPG